MNHDMTKSIMRTASTATVATTAAAAVCGAFENGNPAAAVNAISHIVMGERAAHRDGLSAKYTASGAAVNSAAMIVWAAFHHLVFRPHERAARPSEDLAHGAVTAGIAYVVDYHVVPKQLTPGFEKRLSNVSVFAIYVAMASGLAIGGRLAREHSASTAMV